MKHRKVRSAAALLTVAMCGAAWADEASERALQQRVDEMQKQLDDLARRMSDGSNRSEDELEQRIAELEKATKKDQDGLFAYWKNGLKLDSLDGAFKLSVFGRVQNDWLFWNSEDEITERLGETVGGTEFRRARIGLGGTIYKNVVYKFEMDFAQGVANFADAFIELKDPTCGMLPMTVRVGHFDEPFGFDRLSSSKYGTFMERGLQEAFVPARNTGIMLYGPLPFYDKLQWYAGYFRDANGFGDDVASNSGDLPATPGSTPAAQATQEGTDNDNRGEHNFTFRVAGRPWVSEDGTQFVHLGVATSFRNPSDERVQYRSRPEVHLGPQFVDTGVIQAVDTINLVGLEGGAVFGPFHAAAEWVHSSLEGKTSGNSNGVDNVDQRDYDFEAKSIQVGYFLTGENREYEVAHSRWDRVKVKRNFGTDGMGAVELALRYSRINLNDGNIDGHSLQDVTFGINWYLNPNTRVMLNVIRAERQDLPSITAVGVRFAIDF